MRRWIGDLERQIHAELGRPSFYERARSVLAVGAAIRTAVTLRFDRFQHPKLMRTAYRVPSKRWNALYVWEEMQRKFSTPNLSVKVELQHAKQQVWMRLEGALSEVESEKLGQRIRESLAQTKTRLVLDLKKLHWEKVEDLQPLREKLLECRSRVRLVLPKLTTARPG